MTEQQRLIAWGDELIKLHDGFRADLANLRSGRVAPADLRTHCLAFCDALHLHHEGEDNALFPHLGTEHPELAGVLARLRAEHQVVGGLLARIRRVLEGGGEEVGEEIDQLATRLEAHLDYEEEQLVPVLNKMLTLPDDV
ncbi:hemerythrin domain-containing protein [Nonomuraea sp. NPDC050404]|uniref:hemerythrin domain-containing protein n=1 Tax=Nonomuraea sp. NPDC050404 TaxID=3155783 RepID=UPI003409ECD4